MSGQRQEGNDTSGDSAAEPSLVRWLDAYAARHPRQMFAATVLAAIVATLTLLSQEYGVVVLYQTF